MVLLIKLWILGKSFRFLDKKCREPVVNDGFLPFFCGILSQLMLKLIDVFTIYYDVLREKMIFQDRGPEQSVEIYQEIGDLPTMESLEDQLFNEAFPQDDDDNQNDQRRLYLSQISNPDTTVEMLRDIAYATLDIEVNLALLADSRIGEDLKVYIFEDVILPAYSNNYSSAFLDITNPEIRRFIVSRYQIHFDLAEFIVEAMPEENVTNFLNDPSLIFCSRIPARIFIEDEIVNAELINALILISRYLFTLNIPYSDENAQTAWETLRNIRSNQEIRRIELFADRNVILLSHNEFLNNEEEATDFDEPRYNINQAHEVKFGRPATISGLERQNPRNLEHLRLEDGVDPEEFEDQVLNSIVNAPAHLTFMFDGHGTSDTMGFSENGFISIPHLVEAMEARYEIQGSEVSHDIYIFDGCQHSNFIRNLAVNLSARGIPLPIMMAQSEQSLLGVGDYSDYGTDFIATTLGLAGDSPSTIGSFLDNESATLHNNPVLFIPSSDNTLLQIAKATQNSSVQISV